MYEGIAYKCMCSGRCSQKAEYDQQCRLCAVIVGAADVSHCYSLIVGNLCDAE
jgi:hypothetical protein